MPTIKKLKKKKREIYKPEINYSKFYHDPRYVALRNYFMKEHPLCMDCLEEGRSEMATECHHNIPFGSGRTEKEMYDLLLDYDNLVALCHAHHKLRHAGTFFKKRHK